MLLTESQIRKLFENQILHEKRISNYQSPRGRRSTEAACQLADMELLDAAKEIDALKAKMIADTPSREEAKFDMVPSKILPPCFKIIVAYSMGLLVFLSITIPEI